MQLYKELLRDPTATSAALVKVLGLLDGVVAPDNSAASYGKSLLQELVASYGLKAFTKIMIVWSMSVDPATGYPVVSLLQGASTNVYAASATHLAYTELLIVKNLLVASVYDGFVAKARAFICSSNLPMHLCLLELVTTAQLSTLLLPLFPELADLLRMAQEGPLVTCEMEAGTAIISVPKWWQGDASLGENYDRRREALDAMENYVQNVLHIVFRNTTFNNMYFAVRNMSMEEWTAACNSPNRFAAFVPLPSPLQHNMDLVIHLDDQLRIINPFALPAFHVITDGVADTEIFELELDNDNDVDDYQVVPNIAV